MVSLNNVEDMFWGPEIFSYIPTSEMIYKVYRKAAEMFWSESFWVPKNLSWLDYVSTAENELPHFWDIWMYPIPIAMISLLTRVYIVYPYFLQLAERAGINCHRPPLPRPCVAMQKMFTKYNGKIPRIKVSQLAEGLQWSESDVDLWVYQQQMHGQKSKGEKFANLGFPFVYHNCYNLMGLVVLWNKPWLWDLSLCYQGYPNLPVTTDIWWYYMIAFAFIWVTTCHQVFLEPSRKDTGINLIHHFVTAALLTLSWTINAVRMGTLVLFIHHCNDGLLLGAKLCGYANKELATNILFSLAFLVWSVTRMVIFPFWILHSTVFEAPKVAFMPVGYLFYLFLFTLQILNVIWFGMFVRAAYKKIVCGELEDARSSDGETFVEGQKRKTK